MRLPGWLRRHVAAVRALLVLTVITGVLYPVAVWGIAFLPGLRSRAEGSMTARGSRIIGQSFTDARGNPLRQYFQSRPGAYDPTATGASNLGPEDIVDHPKGRRSLLTDVCARSKAVGELEGVDGSRPYCTPGGVGAVLAVMGPRDAAGRVPRPTRVVSVNEECGLVKRPFLATYRGITVECARYGEDYGKGVILPVRGDAPARPKVPADAVAGSGSGLDPHISPAYARLQAPRVARARGVPEPVVLKAIEDNETGRFLGFVGSPTVNVLQLNVELDRRYPYRG
jgi:K+-transporting ATPase ATPase C chain